MSAEVSSQGRMVMERLDSTQLSAGYVLTGEREFSADEVRAFCELTRDKNPLHRDEEFAGRTRFGRPIVPGLLVASLFADVASKWDLVAQEVSFQFVGPVFVGEKVTAVINITHRDGSRLRADFECKTAASGVVLKGSLKGLSMLAIIRKKTG